MTGVSSDSDRQIDAIDPEQRIDSDEQDIESEESNVDTASSDAASTSNDESGHLDDLADGAGCTEIWEHLSESRD